MSWNINVDAQDNQGNTPLHHAVRTVNEVDSARPFRFLLVRGARTDIRNEKGELVLDLCDQIENENVAN